eukprot:gene27958-34744_t
MLVGAGGNAGNQATVRVIREIAVDSLDAASKRAFVIREIFMACALSGIVGLFGFIRVILFSSSVSMPETITITIALMVIVLISVITGAMLPLLFQLCGVDPANSSTTIQVIMDISGVLITCLVATTLLDSPLGAYLLSLVGIVVAAEAAVLVGNKCRLQLSCGGVASSSSTNANGDGGAATSATLNQPYEVKESSAIVYFADKYNSRIRMMDTAFNIISTKAGNGYNNGGVNGDRATSSAMLSPTGVFVDTNSALYYVEMDGNRIRKVATNTVVTVVGTGTASSDPTAANGDNGAATAATVKKPQAIWADPSGVVYFTDGMSHKVRKVSSSQIISTIAGIGTSDFVNAQGTVASSTAINQPAGIYGVGNVLYITLFAGNTIRTVNTVSGNMIAGYGSSGFSGDGGPGLSAAINGPVAVYVSSTSVLYFADSANHRFRSGTPSPDPTPVPTRTPSANRPTTGASVSATAMSVGFSTLSGLGGGLSGNLYIADSGAHYVRVVIYTSKIIGWMLGTGSSSSSALTANGDGGKGTAASFNTPTGVCESSSYVYIADKLNNKIRMHSVVANIVSTVAGSGQNVVPVNGARATSTGMYYPTGVFVDASSNIYYTEFEAHRIRKVLSSGTANTIAGGNAQSSSETTTGQATSTAFYQPAGVWGYGSVLYVSLQYSHMVRSINTVTGLSTVIAGTASGTFSGDGGFASSAAIKYPTGLYASSIGEMYVADSGNYRVRSVIMADEPTQAPVPPSYQPTSTPSAAPTPPLIINTFAGSSLTTTSGNNVLPTSAGFRSVFGICGTSAGDIGIVDATDSLVRLVAADTGLISYFAGNIGLSNGLATSANGDGGKATSATLNAPIGVTVTLASVVSITDKVNNKIRTVSASNIITTKAGTGLNSPPTNGITATSTSMYEPAGVFVDPTTALYYSEIAGCRLRKINSGTPLVYTLAGTGTASANPLLANGDVGAASSATVSTPNFLWVDTANQNTVYLSDSGNHKIRKVLTSGTRFISTVGGTGQTTFDFTSPSIATSTSMRNPAGIYGIGSMLYVASSFYNILRSINTVTGISTVISGTGSASFSGDGGPAALGTLNGLWGVYVSSVGNVPATSAGFAQLSGVVGMSTSGDIVVADVLGNKVRTISISSGLISDLAGTGEQSAYPVLGNGDNGKATSATFNSPIGLTETLGFVLVGDRYNHKVRRIGVSSSIISLKAGTGSVAGVTVTEGEVATSAKMNGPAGVFLMTSNDMIYCELDGQRLRKITAGSYVTNTIVGTGATSSSSSAANGDGGAATSCAVNNPYFVWADTYGTVYFSDATNHKVRKVMYNTQIITTVVGTGSALFVAGQNSVGTSTPLATPTGLWGLGNKLYIASFFGQTIRTLNTVTGLLSVLVGTGSAAFSGDGGPPTSAAVSSPTGLYVSTTGTMYFSDSGNYRVRLV